MISQYISKWAMLVSCSLWLIPMSFVTIASADENFYAPVTEHRPFNYKAFLAKKRGVPIIEHRPEKTIYSYQTLKALPVWPGYLRFPDDVDLIHAQCGYRWANWAYNNQSSLSDPSALMFDGKNEVQLQDVSLIARLHKRTLDAVQANPSAASYLEKSINLNLSSVTNLNSLFQDLYSISDKASSAPQINPTSINGINNLSDQVGQQIQAGYNFNANNTFLAYLADHKFIFKSHSRTPFLTLSYAKTFFGQKVALSIEVPILRQVNTIRMIGQLSTVDINVLSLRQLPYIGASDPLGDKFFEQYPGGWSQFYNQLLTEKGFTTDEVTRRFGIGDISFFLNRRLESDYFAFGIAGMGLTVPSSTKDSEQHLWPAKLGNDGFWEARAHVAMFWREGLFFNPHLMLEGRFRFSTASDRRVSLLVTHNPNNIGLNTTNAADLPLGQGLMFNDTTKIVNTITYNPPSFLNETESKHAAMAANIQQIEYRKGAELRMRTGAVFDQVFLDRGYIDAFYQFTYKCGDSLTHNSLQNSYDYHNVVHNTQGWEHLLGLAYVFRWQENWQFEGMWNYVFAGHNTLRNVQFSLAGQYKF